MDRQHCDDFISFYLNGSKTKALIEFFHYLVNPYKENSIMFPKTCLIEFIISTEVNVENKSFGREDLRFNIQSMNDDTRELYVKRNYRSGFMTTDIYNFKRFSIWSTFEKTRTLLQKDADGYRLDLTSQFVNQADAKNVVYRQLHEAIWAVIGKASALGANENTEMTLSTKIDNVKAYKGTQFSTIKYLAFDFPFSYENNVVTSIRELKIFDDLLYKNKKSIKSMSKNKKRFVKLHGEEMFKSLVLNEEDAVNMIKKEVVKTLNESIENASKEALNEILAFRTNMTTTSVHYKKAKERLQLMSDNMNKINNI